MDGPPQAILLKSLPKAARRIGILPGSFNPPTQAHLKLAARAQASFQLDHLLFTVSRVTIDKERIEGLGLEDRLLLLSLLVGSLGWTSLAVVNRGLYFEQARAFRRVLGPLPRIYFVVGMDKVIQIFDPRYYADREAALKVLFTEAQLITGGRGTWEKRDLEDLMEKVENRPFADWVHPMSLPDECRDVSSSGVRRTIQAGGAIPDELPQAVRSFLAETEAYRPQYEWRRVLLERLYTVRKWAEEGCSLERILCVVGEASGRGEMLREILRRDEVSPVRLKEALSGLG